MSERLLTINCREVFQCHSINVVVGPLTLCFGDETVLEKTQCFMGPNTYKTLNRKHLQWSNCFTNPSCKLTGTVNVVGLNISCKVFLGSKIESNHSVCKGTGERTEIGNDFQSCSIVCPINLC